MAQDENPAVAPADPSPSEEPAKPKRRRRVKPPEPQDAVADAPTEERPKRRPGRPRKKPVEPSEDAPAKDAATAAPEAGAAKEKGAEGEDEAKPKRRPGRPRKKPAELADEAAQDRQDDAKGAKGATKGSDDARDDRGQDKAEKASRDDRDRGDRTERNDRDRGQNRGGNNGHQQNGKGYSGRNGNGHQQNGRSNRNNRHKKQVQTAPSLTREELEALKVAELRTKAAEYDVDAKGLRKAELVDAIYDAAARAEGFRTVTGILEITNENYGFVRTDHYMQGEDDAFVQQAMIRNLGLRRGDLIEGTVRPAGPGNKFPPVARVTAVNGKDPELARRRPRFRDLTPVYPNERLYMETGRESITGRAIDLVAPVGKGQRGLIVSPPKAGKTTVLKHICQSIARNNPEVHLICLLVDERPEEVTDMERSIRGDVVASTFDMPADNHTHVAELVIERAKRLVEEGEDVVVVLDSITRLARAYNLAAPASGRILSGGVDSAALYPPKRFLGAARNIENGGSLTILASALVDTGSKMDEVIFEEFKGTGNMELKLDRELADKRIFPAIDPVQSGTRNEELLIAKQMQPFVWGLRRVLANMNNVERAEASLVKGLKQTETNQEFLIRSAKKAAQLEYSD